jgi:hypothetical protein
MVALVFLHIHVQAGEVIAAVDVGADEETLEQLIADAEARQRRDQGVLDFTVPRLNWQAESTGLYLTAI